MLGNVMRRDVCHGRRLPVGAARRGAGMGHGGVTRKRIPTMTAGGIL